MGLKVKWLAAKVLCHATEDERKVFRALETVLGNLDQVDVERQALRGHYGDSIVLLAVTTDDSAKVSNVIGKLSQSLTEYEKLSLVDSALDMKAGHEGSLYVRLDKQEAFLGRLRLADQDAIRLEIRFVGTEQDLKKELGV